MISPVFSNKLVVVDYSGVLKGIERVEDLVAGDKNDILRYAAGELRRETDRAFAQKVDPEGGAWPARKHSYPWPMLNNTGTLKGMLGFGWGITKRDKSPRIFAKVKDAVYMQRSYRGGTPEAGFTYGNPGVMRKSAFEVVASVFYGRSRTRTVEGWRNRRMGRGRTAVRSTWSYGGGRGYSAAESGVVPPRPFFGFGGAAQARVKRYAERMVGRAYNISRAS
jgi:phage gpG-like protein